MSTRSSNLETPGDNAAPVIGIGGLGTGPECKFWYMPLIDDGLDWDMPPEDRFLHMPNRGLGKYPDMLKSLEDKVLAISERLGRTAVIVGHSMGALPAQDIVLDNHNIASDVIVAAGAHDGKKYETPASLLLRHALTSIPFANFLHDPETANDLNHDSAFMIQRRQRVATEWPASVRLHGISTFYDDLLPFTHGLELELPEGQRAERRVIALPLPGMENIMQLLARNTDILHIPSLRPAFHVDIVRHPAFINYVRELQHAAGFDEISSEISSKPLVRLRPQLAA